MTHRRPTFSALSTGTFTVISLCRILIVRYSRCSPRTSLTSLETIVPAPWWGYTTLSPTSNTPRALPSSGPCVRLAHEKRRRWSAGVYPHSTEDFAALGPSAHLPGDRQAHAASSSSSAATDAS